MEKFPCNYLVISHSVAKLFPRVCFVYGWYRPGTGYLYIGKTNRGLRRMTDHHVINIAERVRACDELHIWMCGQPELKDLEYNLTKELIPYYVTFEGCVKRGLIGVGKRYKRIPKLVKSKKPKRDTSEFV